MRVLYIAQWFEPEPMMKGTGFVRALRARGHEVEVVTGFPNYPKGRLYPGYRIALHRADTVEGVPIHRVALYPSHGTSSIGRIVNYFSFALSAAIHGLFRARSFDVIYVYPPIPAALAAALIGAVRRRPFVMDIQDLWPDSVVTSGMAGTGRMAGILSALCNFAYARAAHIVAQSRGIATRLAERGVAAEKVEVIYNWADEDAAAPGGTCDLAQFGFAGHFNFVYGGNFGRLQGLDTMIRAAHEAAKTEPTIRLFLIGDGMETETLRALATEIGATNVAIEPGVPRAQIGDVFAAADVLAMHLLDDPLFEITIPQKTQFYMAMGKPVLIGVRGEASRFIEEAGAGIVVPPNDVSAMAAAMIAFARIPAEDLAAMGGRARTAYARTFAFDTAIAQTEAVLAKAIGGRDHVAR